MEPSGEIFFRRLSAEHGYTLEELSSRPLPYLLGQDLLLMGLEMLSLSEGASVTAPSSAVLPGTSGWEVGDATFCGVDSNHQIVVD